MTSRDSDLELLTLTESESLAQRIWQAIEAQPAGTAERMRREIAAGAKPIGCCLSEDGQTIRASFAGVPLLEVSRAELSTNPQLN